ncbi:MAG: septal ring lytic transglycosylase RlpA family protein [Pseudolabrys sp.]
MASTLRIAFIGALAAAGAAGLAGAQELRQFSGIAAYYDKNYNGKTASGALYDPRKFTAAHRTLPFGTRLTVRDPRSGRSVEVVVNDRGPFTKGRVLDLSLAAARELRMLERGLLKVTADIAPGAVTRADDRAPAR